ncbi:MAG TPA: GNAT family N-acetyltransferase [Pyrinomonadaceae bacterium]|nr:GNAT family N-acetyltransferase [Pyrinomonadaceae bacterium]
MQQPQTEQLSVSPLAESHGAEVLSFLAERPVDNVIMSGFIRDNGMVSTQNRGRFYGCRNGAGALEGVALIGHGMSFDARSEAVTESFARLTRQSPGSRLLMGESGQVRRFWRYYAPDGSEPSLLRDVFLLEQRLPFDGCEEIRNLRPALPGDLAEVAALHAGMVGEETGTDPLRTDREGFLRRCLQRIEQGRTWAWFEGGRIIYKADVIAQTPEAAYIEGICVHPQERHKGYGRRCLAQMGRQLLQQANAICLFVDERNGRAQDFYFSIGYAFASRYHILYF